MRINNVFSPEHKSIRYREIWSVDTEDDSKGNLIMIILYNAKKFHIFRSQYDFICFLQDFAKQNKRRTIHIVMTNLEYDIINCFRGFFELVQLNYSDKLISAKLKNSNIHFFDSLNHYKLSVKEQGKMIKLHKLDFDRHSVKYAQRDAEITQKFMAFYQKTLNHIGEKGTELRNTIASSALDCYKRNFLKEEIIKPPDEVIEKMSNAYYGGRSEIFKMTAKSHGDNKLRYYDVNSLYPTVMSLNKFPSPNTLIKSNRGNIDMEGVSHAKVRYIKNLYIPYLPVRTEKLIFPLGKLKGWWSNYELRYAVENGFIQIEKVYESVNFRASNYYFKDYCLYMYKKRKQYKGVDTEEAQFYSLTYKLLMNSLYGKFAEEVETQKVLGAGDEIVDINDGEKYFPAHTNYIWSIYTTAYARTYLFEGLKKVVDSGGQPCYCDTDSNLYLGKDNVLNSGKELGQWDMQGEYKEGSFYLPKTYILTDYSGQRYYTAKGVGSKYHEEFFRTFSVEVEKPIKLRESYRRVKGITTANYWLKQRKTLKAQYDKRIVLKGKEGETKPLVLDMW